MRAAIQSIVLVLAFAGACSLHAQQRLSGGGPVSEVCGSDNSSVFATPRPAAPGRQWSCIPPYETPAYTKPADASIVFGSLLEAAGYSPLTNVKINWVGVAAGNLCGGSEKQLALVQNDGFPNFSVLDGPTPILRNRNFPIGGLGDLSNGGLTNLTNDSSASHPWRALAVGNLDGSPQDAIVAVRKVTAAGVPDLVVAKTSSCTPPCTSDAPPCERPTVIASTLVGNSSDSDWLAVAVGNFFGGDWQRRSPLTPLSAGTGNVVGPFKKQIALLKVSHPQLTLLELSQGTLSVVHRQDLDSDMSHPSNWKVMAAGDIDGAAGIDELIVARQVSDGQNPTVLTFKWDAGNSIFQPLAPLATSTFGNGGNSEWSGVAAGDFSAAGRKAIVLVKNAHSNFVVMDLLPGQTQLRILSTADLDSEPGQNWTGLAATDWLRGDQGAEELIAVRRVDGSYRTNIFVYGNPFHRVSRDTALIGTKALFDQHWDPGNGQWFTPTTGQLMGWLRYTHANTFNWFLQAPNADDYRNLVEFLSATRNWGVDGKQLRVWVTLINPGGVTDDPSTTDCALPEPTPEWTSWDAAKDYFNLPPNPDSQQFLAACKNTLAWASVIGRLAQDFPHLVGMGIDDFCEEAYNDGHCFDMLPNGAPRTDDTHVRIAEIEARMRSQAPWLNFVPTVYYNKGGWPHWPDLPLTFDSMIFYFRNEEEGQGACAASSCPLIQCGYDQSGSPKFCPPPNWGCLDSFCAEPTVKNAPGEVAEMAYTLPAGRKMQAGVYFAGHSKLGVPSVAYDFNLTGVLLSLPSIGGVTAYTTAAVWPSVWPPDAATSCTDANVLQFTYCALQKVFGSSSIKPCQTQPPTTLCGNACVDTNTDNNNCGSCGNACRDIGSALSCRNGVCGCPAGTASCCGGDFCANKCPPPRHCGSSR